MVRSGHEGASMSAMACYQQSSGKRRSFQRKVLVILVLRVRPLSPLGLLAVALLLVTPLAAQDAASAKALLESAFRLYKNGGKGVDTHSNRYYHSSLKALMTADEKAARDKGTDIPFARGADNFCGCQEWEGFWVSKMDLSVQTRDRAEAVVSFSVYAPKNRRNTEARMYKYILVPEHGNWRIYDILYLSDSDDSAKSLRENISQDIEVYSHEPTQ